MIKFILKRLVFMAILFSFAMVSFAEEAPVYDVDNMPQQFDGQEAVEPSVPVAQEAQAPTPKEKPLVQEEPQPQQPQPSQAAENSDQVKSLQGEVQTLRGQVEELTHQLKQAQEQQKEMYSDLDKRVNKTQQQPAVAKSVTPKKPPAAVEETATEIAKKSKEKQDVDSDSATEPDVVAEAPPPKQTAAQPNVEEEQQIYQTAYNLIKEKKYNDAVNALEKMLQKYPSGQFAANAHYWLGELYGLMGKSTESANQFATVIKNYPDSPKVSDSQLKLGLIYAQELKWAEAKLAFKKVVSQYPGSASARLAQDQLKQIKQAGH